MHLSRGSLLLHPGSWKASTNVKGWSSGQAHFGLGPSSLLPTHTPHIFCECRGLRMFFIQLAIQSHCGETGLFTQPIFISRGFSALHLFQIGFLQTSGFPVFHPQSCLPVVALQFFSLHFPCFFSPRPSLQ